MNWRANLPNLLNPVQRTEQRILESETLTMLKSPNWRSDTKLGYPTRPTASFPDSSSGIQITIGLSSVRLCQFWTVQKIFCLTGEAKIKAYWKQLCIVDQN